MRKFHTIDDIERFNKETGGCWFHYSSMRFFGTSIESGVIKKRFFITSEHNIYNTGRFYTVRQVLEDGSIGTVGEFLGFKTRTEAVKFIRSLDSNE